MKLDPNNHEKLTRGHFIIGVDNLRSPDGATGIIADFFFFFRLNYYQLISWQIEKKQ